MPTLVVQMEVTRGMEKKPVNAGKGIEPGLVAMIAPFPLSHARGFMPMPDNRDRELETQWYYAGTVLMAGGYVGWGRVGLSLPPQLARDASVDRHGHWFRYGWGWARGRCCGD